MYMQILHIASDKWIANQGSDNFDRLVFFLQHVGMGDVMHTEATLIHTFVFETRGLWYCHIKIVSWVFLLEQLNGCLEKDQTDI